jgi:ankyrin repeat protein
LVRLLRGCDYLQCGVIMHKTDDLHQVPTGMTNGSTQPTDLPRLSQMSTRPTGARAQLDAYEACRFLIDNGATVNTHSSTLYGTPLQEALKHQHIEIANLLLDKGADINALPAQNRGVTALQAAAINSMLGMTIRLLERGADFAAPAAPVEGRTAIDGAAERGNWDMVQLLLNAYEALEVDVGPICSQAAEYAYSEGYSRLGRWLQGYARS